MAEYTAVHYSVLQNEVVEYLEPAFSAVSGEPLLIDGTLGEGGHSALFLQQFPDIRVIGLDRDSEILGRARQRLAPFGDRISVIQTWFDDFFADWESNPGFSRPAAVLFDFGISIYHYEVSGRGFSFGKDEPLDMRLDRGGTLTAEYIVNTYERDRLADIIYAYGEERYSRRIAAALCRKRAEEAITSSAQLAAIIAGSVPKEYRYGRIHPATRTFQALRIAVNGELERIDRVLRQVVDALQPGGRIGVISFHSLEDRRVKQLFKQLSLRCTCPPETPRCECGGRATVKLLTKKPVRPSESEVAINPASRSAKFRCAEKL